MTARFVLVQWADGRVEVEANTEPNPSDLLLLVLTAHEQARLPR